MIDPKLREIKRSKAVLQNQFHSEQNLSWGSDERDGHAEAPHCSQFVILEHDSNLGVISMEHRNGPRESVEWETIIRVPEGAPLSGRARDFSNGGLFVELPPHTLPINTLITVSAVRGEGPDLRVEHWPAVVVHRSLTGVGLMFVELAAPNVGNVNELAATLPASELADMRQFEKPIHSHRIGSP